MRNSYLGGVVLALCGILVAVFGFLSLSILSDWCLVNQNTGCPDPSLIVNFVFYMATVGSTLTVLGSWKAVSERVRIFAEGSGVTMAFGLLVLWFAFSLFGTLPAFSFLLSLSPRMPPQSAYLVGLAGGGLFMGGVVKLGVGEKRFSPSPLTPVQSGLVSGEPRLSYELLTILLLGFLATLVSGLLVSSEFITPGGGGFYWGFPYSWKSVTGWLGISYGFRYDWFWFVIDVLSYTAIAFFILFLFWTNSGVRGRRLMQRFIESRKIIAITALISITFFAGSLLYDYAYLWNLR